MGFTNSDPWNHFEVSVNPADNTVKWGECESCGGSGPKNGFSLDPLINDSCDTMVALIEAYHDHLKKSHNIWPPCGFFVTVGEKKHFCTLMENHMRRDFVDPRVQRDQWEDGPTGAIPHEFSFEISLEEERKMMFNGPT